MVRLVLFIFFSCFLNFDLKDIFPVLKLAISPILFDTLGLPDKKWRISFLILLSFFLESQNCLASATNCLIVARFEFSMKFFFPKHHRFLANTCQKGNKESLSTGRSSIFDKIWARKETIEDFSAPDFIESQSTKKKLVMFVNYVERVWIKGIGRERVRRVWETTPNVHWFPGDASPFLVHFASIIHLIWLKFSSVPSHPLPPH